MKTLLATYFAARTWWLAGALPFVLTYDGHLALSRYISRRCGSFTR